MRHDSGSFTQNGHFYAAAHRVRESDQDRELVRVCEKLRRGVWVFNGTFDLVDAWIEASGGRDVFKFRLQLLDVQPGTDGPIAVPSHNRLIPSAVKQEVWKRDGGRCVMCESTDHLHFDHVIPFSKGGASIVAENIQLLCARHNLEKRDRIE